MLIYKIFRAPEWQALQAAGETKGSPAIWLTGFIHFSTAAQVDGTAARHFAGQGGLVLCAGRGGTAGRVAGVGAVARRRSFPPSLRGPCGRIRFCGPSPCH